MDKKDVNEVMNGFIESVMDAFSLEYMCYQRSRRGAFLRGFMDDRPSWSGDGWLSPEGFAMEMQLTRPLYLRFEKMVLASSYGWCCARDDGKGVSFERCIWSREEV